MYVEHSLSSAICAFFSSFLFCSLCSRRRIVAVVLVVVISLEKKNHSNWCVMKMPVIDDDPLCRSFRRFFFRCLLSVFQAHTVRCLFFALNATKKKNIWDESLFNVVQRAFAFQDFSLRPLFWSFCSHFTWLIWSHSNTANTHSISTSRELCAFKMKKMSLDHSFARSVL